MQEDPLSFINMILIELPISHVYLKFLRKLFDNTLRQSIASRFPVIGLDKIADILLVLQKPIQYVLLIRKIR